MKSDTITQINKLLNSQSCIIYRLPQSNKLTLCTIKGSSEISYNHFDETAHPHGFVVFPFDKHNEKAWWFETEETQTELANHTVNELPVAQNETILCENTFESYSKQFNQMRAALEAQTVQKVILSRRIKIEQNLLPHLSNIYLKLCSTAVNAFVYLLHTPQTGIWIGASPEILLDRTGNTVTTVSLAGTRTISDSAIEKWRNKEQEEQQLVSSFIDVLLHKNEITNFKKIGPIVVKAGNVTHLKTKYTFPFSKIKNRTGQFIEQLHPTPALCGKPKEKAMQLIRKAESHKREYYGGFLGPIKKNTMHLFVNIRCMKVNQKHSTIFAGGGLTSLSVLQEEWDETILKSRMLLSAVEISLQKAQI